VRLIFTGKSNGTLGAHVYRVRRVLDFRHGTVAGVGERFKRRGVLRRNADVVGRAAEKEIAV
jgi:hypothetical protein